jgi:hypothetical protein
MRPTGDMLADMLRQQPRIFAEAAGDTGVMTMRSVLP